MSTAGTATPGMGTPGISTPGVDTPAVGDTSNPRQNFGDDAPPAPVSTEATEAGIDAAFVADRQMFWSRFTSFTTGAVIAVVVLLIAMAVFLV